MSDPRHIVPVAGAFFNEQGHLLLVKLEEFDRTLKRHAGSGLS